MLLSACILFPPFWPGGDPGSPTELVVENDTDEDWVLSFGSEVGLAFAIGAGETGTVMAFGLAPAEIVLLDPECAEVDRMAWDAAASGVRISDPGILSVTDAALADATTAFAEYWECIDDVFDIPPEPGGALSEAGGTILLSSGGGTVFVLDVEAATVARFGDDSAEGTDVEHAWSPDGSRLAFTRTSDTDYDSDVYVAAADGTDEVLLAEDATSPRWSPDGGQIAYVSTDPFAAAAGLVVIEADGGEPFELAENASPAAWSPDGEQLAFVTSPDSFEMPAGELRIVSDDGSGLTTLADAAPFAGPPAWSPDGTRILFVGLPEGADPAAFDIESVVSVHDIGTGETSVLAAIDGAGLGEPTWSPDGETVAFTIISSGLFAASGALATVPAVGGPITRVNEEAGAYFATPLWAPDGEWLAVSRSNETDPSASLVAFRPDGTDETVLATSIISATGWRDGP